jgi:hypothetical protein
MAAPLFRSIGARSIAPTHTHGVGANSELTLLQVAPHETASHTAAFVISLHQNRAVYAYRKLAELIYPRGPEHIADGQDLHLYRNTLRMGGGRLYLQAGWALISALSQIVPALAMHEVTQYMEDYDEGTTTATDKARVVLMCVGGLVLSQCVATYADGFMFKLGRRLGVRSVNLLCINDSCSGSCILRCRASLNMCHLLV